MEDEFGILDIVPPRRVADRDQRAIDQFIKITAFVAGSGGQEPDIESADHDEAMLAAGLRSCRRQEKLYDLLAPYDDLNLLTPTVSSTSGPSEAVEPAPVAEVGVPKTLDEAFEGDLLDFLDDDDLGIYNLRHVPQDTTMPDYIAGRKKCTDFADFEPLLKDCSRELRAGKRQLTRFRNEQQIAKGYFFVLKGILLYVAEVGERVPDANGKTNARLRVIFDNGTESDLLLRSLAAELYKDGKRITEHEDRQLANFYAPTEEDTTTGHIYVLRSLSADPGIAAIEDLYKIGFSDGPVAERIKNASREPTYLMAPVLEVAGWECLNAPPRNFERLLHQFFGDACLDVEVTGPDGRIHHPREWFIAPLPIIRRAVEMLISGEIVKYRYDNVQLAVVQR